MCLLGRDFSWREERVSLAETEAFVALIWLYISLNPLMPLFEYIKKNVKMQWLKYSWLKNVDEERAADNAGFELNKKKRMMMGRKRASSAPSTFHHLHLIRMKSLLPVVRWEKWKSYWQSVIKQNRNFHHSWHSSVSKFEKISSLMRHLRIASSTCNWKIIQESE